MTENKKEKKSVSIIYALGFPINITIELLIQLISVSIPVILILKSLNTENPLIVIITVVAGLYFYALMILILTAITTRILPKPKLGNLKAGGEELKFQILAALNRFMRRTPAQWLLIFPFPGHLFYKLANPRIDSSAFILDQNIPDVYLVSIGKNVLLGDKCSIFGHYSSNSSSVFLGKVEIGNHVLIGENATVWPNVSIGDGSIVQNKSVVQCGTIIPPNEIWGGLPARKIKSIEKNNNFTQTPSLEPEQVEKYIQELLLSDYNLQSVDKNAPLLSLGLEAQNITRMLSKLEKRYDLFIDRTEIELSTFSFNDILSTIQK